MALTLKELAVEKIASELNPVTGLAKTDKLIDDLISEIPDKNAEAFRQKLLSEKKAELDNIIAAEQNVVTTYTDKRAEVESEITKEAIDEN